MIDEGFHCPLLLFLYFRISLKYQESLGWSKYKCIMEEFSRSVMTDPIELAPVLYALSLQELELKALPCE